MLVLLDYTAACADVPFSIHDWMIEQKVSYYRNQPNFTVPHDTSKLIISGGPWHTRHCWKAIDTIRQLNVPIFGICLGCMCIVEAFGGTLEDCEERKSPMEITIVPPIIDRETTIQATVANRQRIVSVGPELVQIGTGKDQECMAVMHKTRPVFGVMFHPESPQTTCGSQLLRSFLELR